VAVAVAKERMRSGDSVEVKTPNAVAGIRGTILIAEVVQESANRANTQFTLLTGIVDVSGLDAATGRATGPRVTMQPLQTLGVAGFTRPSAPRNISRTDAQAVAAAYKVSVPAPSAAANAPMVERQVEQGLAAAAALVPVDPKAKGDTNVDPNAVAADGPTQDGAVDDGRGDKSAKDRKAPAPGGSSGAGKEGPALRPRAARRRAQLRARPRRPLQWRQRRCRPPRPTAQVPTAPAPTTPTVSGSPAPPPPALPPVASLPLPGNDKKGGPLDDVTKKLPKLPKPK
jgi:hypothetical protein